MWFEVVLQTFPLYNQFIATYAGSDKGALLLILGSDGEFGYHLSKAQVADQ